MNKKLAIAVAATGLGAAGIAAPAAFSQQVVTQCPAGATNPAYCTTITVPAPPPAPPVTNPGQPGTTPAPTVVLRGLSIARVLRQSERQTRVTARLTLSQDASVYISLRKEGSNGRQITVQRTNAVQVRAGRRAVRFYFDKRLTRGSYTAVAVADFNGSQAGGRIKDREDLRVTRRGTGAAT